MKCRSHMRLAPLHDLRQLVPVVNLLKLHILHRRTGNNHTIKALAADLVKRHIKLIQMRLRCIFRNVRFSIRNEQSTCSGVFESARRSCVSVSSLIGIRFRIKISSGRISWLIARSSSITNIFSDSKIALAGRSFVF